MNKIIACNWKMNLNDEECLDLSKKIYENIDSFCKGKKCIIFPSLLHLQKAAEILEKKNIQLGFQNIYPSDLGAFTGETSPMQLKNQNITYGLVGHSERRQFLNETNSFCNQKIRFLLENQLKVVYCVGESLEQRKKNQTFDFLSEQLVQGLENVHSVNLKNIIIAYEPIWAIGTSQVATLEQIEEVHAFIKNKIHSLFSQEILVLYGGSVKPNNVGEILNQKNVDGVLVGGASQKFDSLKSLF